LKKRTVTARRTTTSHAKTELNERLSAVERDVSHLDSQLAALSHEMQDGFIGLRRAIDAQRQPLTAFAGWAAVVLTLVAAVMWPQLEKDSRHELRIDHLEKRELADAYSRGMAEQKFATLEADIDAAIANRKDKDDAHRQAGQRLSERIDEVQHSLDNGLGRRIKEMQDPLKERILALERSTFYDSPNRRDMDRE
jgi:predicted  nucleic acid-binding Zn-ribbon protein